MPEQSEDPPTPSPDPASKSSGASPTLANPSTPPIRRLKRFVWGSLGRLALKELRETLRDRRTIVTLLLMPLIVYPVLSLAFQRILVLYFEPADAPAARIGFIDEEHVEPFTRALLLGDSLLSESEESGEQDASESEGGGAPAIPDLFGQGAAGNDEILSVEESRPSWKVSADLEGDLRSDRIDIGIDVVEVDGVKRFKLVYHDSLPNSLRALRFVVDRLRAVNEDYGRQTFRRAGVPGYPAEFDRQAISSGAVGGVSLGIILPLILVLMTITGAVYPAIDLTAGERERGTLESLLATPVSRLGLLTAKYIAVVVVAQLTAIMNLLAMMLTVTVSGLGPYLFPGGEFSILVIFQILGLLFLFAAFFSAVLLVLTSMARSFKEAQAYLIPIMMLSISPALVSLVPDINLSSWFHVPLLNMVLFARDLIEGTVDPRYGALTVATTLIYTCTAAALAARLFGTDTVLYGSQGSWKDLFRRPVTHVDGPTLSGSLGALVTMFPAFFVTAGMLSLLKLPRHESLIVSGIAYVVLFALFPLLYCVIFRIRLDKTFPMRPHWLGMLTAIVWGFTAWMFAHEIVVVSHKFGMVMLDAKKFAMIEEVLEQWRALPLVLLLLTQAVAPAVCEEIFFRGMIFRGIQRDVSPWAAWFWSSLLFAAFHVVSGNVLALERFFPSLWAGLLLGSLRLRTGSLLPGMLMHMLYNGLLLSAAYYKDDLMEAGWGLAEREHLPITWLATAVVSLAVGAAILFASTRSAKSGSDSESVSKSVGSDRS